MSDPLRYALDKVQQIAEGFAVANGIELDPRFDPARPDLAWFQVGLNATHYFYLTVDAAGRVLKSNLCPEEDEDTTMLVQHMQEVPVDNLGYLGHF